MLPYRDFNNKNINYELNTVNNNNNNSKLRNKSMGMNSKLKNKLQSRNMDDMNIMSPFDLMGQMMNMDLSLRNQFESLSQFSGLHHDIFSNNNNNNNRISNGNTVYSRSYVHETRIDQNGQKQEEKYYQDQFVQKDNRGNTISERNQAYQNNQNNRKQQLIAQERMLNDQGRKFIKQREIDHNNNVRIGDTLGYYYGMQPDQQEQFDNKWNAISNDLQFHQNRDKQLQYRYSNNNALKYH